MSDIYLFNPTGEMAIANGNHSYMAPKMLRIFERDLAFMPTYFANDHDIIICDEEPYDSFLKEWQTLGLPKTNYLSIKEALKADDINYLKPWSWNPASHHLLRNLKLLASDAFKTSPNHKWDNTNKLFFSRESCNKVQKYIFNNINNSSIKISKPAISLNSVEEIKEWLTINKKAVIKMPWSSSGRGIHIVDLQNNRPLNLEWVSGAIKQQGFVCIEPLLNKVKDFSYQLKLNKNGEIDFLGISHFNNDSKGHFTGGIIKWPHKENEISNFFNEEVIQETSEALIQAISSISPNKHYEGHLGVDGIIYRDENKQLKIHPCLDINWRYNMGNVNIMLPNYVAPNSKGEWKIDSFKTGEWNEFTRSESKKKPLKISGGKISSGFKALTPPADNAMFGAWLEVFE
ncbi:hypothetical protein [Saccharicrinis aurantiacus]|uniref:hypothetical protein n=1 Tax=Saccharicrinis aurantiacus TaxID=1849719 RepID=UPI002492C5BB|nr:hypothetical protein [Saccharicrinis aurantiacus]